MSAVKLQKTLANEIAFIYDERFLTELKIQFHDTTKLKNFFDIFAVPRKIFQVKTCAGSCYPTTKHGRKR